MRTILCLALLAMMGVLLLSTNTRPVKGCTDWDEDGVCGYNDCNDYNPTTGYNGDADGDGLTVCQGDCDDGDAANKNKCMAGVFQMYPVFYQPPEQPCREGFRITTQQFHCWTQPDGSLLCETTPFYEYDTDYLRDCY